MSLPCQGQNSMAGKPKAAACFTRSGNGSFVHHISRFAANLVCGVFSREEVSSAARADLVVSDKAAPPTAALVARNERRSRVDMEGLLLLRRDEKRGQT